MNNQVLIVEDERDTAELLRYNLEKEHYETLIARTGEDAIDAVQCHEPVVVLLDLMLPKLDGWEVCRILRGSSKGSALPIIMLTALSDEEARIKGLALGADDYVAKPFSVKELLLKIRKCVDRQRALRQLEAREQERETSLRYLVHELKNAMTIIGAYSALALKKDDPRNYLHPMNTAALHAENLLNNASLLTRLEKTRSTLPTEPLDLVAVTEQVVEMLRHAAKQRGMELAVMKGGRSLVRANRTAVRQVLVNLLSNAMKYNRTGGRIWISFDERNGSMTVSITDEGRGVRPDELPRIFEKFYRASGSEGVKGSGLGLYIVRHLMNAMGGAITVESDQGTGSTFIASFAKISPMPNIPTV